MADHKQNRYHKLLEFKKYIAQSFNNKKTSYFKADNDNGELDHNYIFELKLKELSLEIVKYGHEFIEINKPENPNEPKD